MLFNKLHIIMFDDFRCNLHLAFIKPNPNAASVFSLNLPQKTCANYYFASNIIQLFIC